MTVSYCFLTKTNLKESDIEAGLRKCWFGPEYSVSAIKDGDFIVSRLEYAFGDIKEEKMARAAIQFLSKNSMDGQIFYARCDDPFFLDAPIKKIKIDDIFTPQYAPAYYDGQQYLYEIENP